MWHHVREEAPYLALSITGWKAPGRVAHRRKSTTKEKVMNQTVIQHVLGRLHDIGIKDVFGVPGDLAFPVNDAIPHIPAFAGSAAATS
jgi:hypothetical protein